MIPVNVHHSVAARQITTSKTLLIVLTRNVYPCLEIGTGTEGMNCDCTTIALYRHRRSDVRKADAADELPA